MCEEGAKTGRQHHEEKEDEWNWGVDEIDESSCSGAEDTERDEISEASGDWRGNIICILRQWLA